MFSSIGVLSGTPTAAGTYSFTVMASDTLGATASESYTVTIGPPLSITTTALGNGDVGTAYAQTIGATGGSGSYTFSQTGGTLPTGLKADQRPPSFSAHDHRGQLLVHGDGDGHVGRQC